MTDKLIYTGGPAFPCAAPLYNDGMTLRDWFAAMSMAAVANRYGSFVPETFAIDAYEVADAMLEARRK